MNQINRVGNILPTRTRENPNQGRVYDVTGIAPAICCGGGTPLVVERRFMDAKIQEPCREEIWKIDCNRSDREERGNIPLEM